MSCKECYARKSETARRQNNRAINAGQCAPAGDSLFHRQTGPDDPDVKPQKCLDIVRGTHLGQRSSGPRKQAGHMTAFEPSLYSRSLFLELSRPSTHESEPNFHAETELDPRIEMLDLLAQQGGHVVLSRLAPFATRRAA